MERARHGIAVAVLLVAGLSGGCAEQAARPARVDPRADEALRKMSAALGSATAFSFRSVSTMDEPVATGQMAQFSRETRVLVRRPDRVFAEARQDQDELSFWYEGRAVTVVDKASNTYAAVQVPARIDDMLDELANKHGLTLPLADLLFADPYKVLTADVLTGKCVGLHEVGGVKCTHLLFTQENVDWQIWIDAGKEPLPRKIVIDYKTVPGRPEFSAVLSDWDLSPSAEDGRFKPAVPNGAKKVELARLFETATKGE
jgi:hypothetical protein